MLTILIHSLIFTCRAPIRKQHPINNLFDFTISFCSFNFQKRNFLHRILQMRSCVFKPKHGIGAFGVFPVLQRKRCNFIKKILYQHMICILVLLRCVNIEARDFFRVSAQDYGVMGLRYGSGNLSFGATVMPFTCM